MNQTHIGVGCSDSVFGPASCSHDFNLCLIFEQSVFSIIASAILLLLTPVRLFQLSRRHTKASPNQDHASKAVSFCPISLIQSKLTGLDICCIECGCPARPGPPLELVTVKDLLQSPICGADPRKLTHDIMPFPCRGQEVNKTINSTNHLPAILNPL